MAVFQVELPDKRVLDIEAADQDTAIRGAQEWHAGNPQGPLGRLEQHDFGDAYRGSNGEMIAVNPGTDVVRDGFVYPRGGAPNTRTESSLTQGMRGVARNIRGDSTSDNVLAGGIDTAANWLDWAPEPGADTLAPLGAAVVGSMGLGIFGRPDNMVGVFGGRLPTATRAPVDSGGGPAAAVPRPQAAAEQMIADTLTRAGRTPDDLRAVLSNMDEARHFHSSGAAQDRVALADLDESLTRLAGSVARQSPEAARNIREFLHARQTGHTPRNLEPIDMADRGLPTREAFTDPITGAQAKRRLGRKFDTADDDPVPMGAMESMRDALRRAFLISDSDYHGHGATGLRTEQKILRSARDAADANYRAAEVANSGVNLRSALDAVFDRHIAEAAATRSPTLENVLKRARQTFRSGPIELRQFDRIKRELDDTVERFLNRTDKGGKQIGGALTAMKNDLLNAVDEVTGGDTSLYRSARSAYSSDMDMLNALRMGRESLKDNSEVAADNFLALATEGERKLFRLGQIDSVTARGLDKSRAHDFTQVFKTPRVEALLTATIPRSKKGGAEFADRPQRFGRYVDAQSQMIEARNTVQGGSTTMRNAADDAASDLLQTIALKEFTSFLNMFRSSQSTWHFGQQMLTNAIDKAFGVRADVAKNLAEMLFTADAAQRAAILDSVAQRMPRSRMERFNQIMTEYTQAMERGGGPAALRSTLTEEQQQSSSPRDPKTKK